MDSAITVTVIHQVSNYAEMIKHILALDVIGAGELARLIGATQEEFDDFLQLKKSPSKTIQKKLTGLYVKACQLQLIWAQE